MDSYPKTHQEFGSFRNADLHKNVRNIIDRVRNKRVLTRLNRDRESLDIKNIRKLQYFGAINIALCSLFSWIFSELITSNLNVILTFMAYKTNVFQILKR